jgi:toxin ParE1/3/4
MKKFRLSAEAAGDLTEIFDYIAEDSIAAAQRVRADIHDQLKKLAQTPGMGHRRPDLTSEKLLFWPLYPYLIIYQPASNPLHVVAVLHGSRDVRRILVQR